MKGSITYLDIMSMPYPFYKNLIKYKDELEKERKKRQDDVFRDREKRQQQQEAKNRITAHRNKNRVPNK